VGGGRGKMEMEGDIWGFQFLVKFGLSLSFRENVSSAGDTEREN
jgi:hypothetical protein